MFNIKSRITTLDEADMAQIQVDAFLNAALLRHSNQLKQCGDIESAICKGCSYATKKAFGKTCDGWKECLEDHDKRK